MTVDTLYLDTETFSPVPINRGTHAYAEQVEVMLVTYALDDGEDKVWDRTADYIPTELHNAIREARVIVIHNSQFDRTVIRQPHDMGIDIPVDRIFDTMACALSHSMPGKLDTLCTVLGVGEEDAKHKSGTRLINLFCKPNRKGGRNTRDTHPQEWEEFKDYARADIRAMRRVYKLLPKWNYPNKERGVFALDQRINDRGFAVDTELAEGAILAVTAAQEGLSARTMELTDGELESTRKRAKLLEHIIKYYDVWLPDMKASTVEWALNDAALPWALRELLAIRLQQTTTSTAKYQALMNAVAKDNRLHAALQYCGALRTGRWSGRLFQPQNLPRPAMSAEFIDLCIEAFKLGCIDLIVDNVMDAASNCLRGLIVAAEGKKLCVADLSNIEGRVLAWLAGETWKVEAFRAYDNGTGPDLYKLAYGKAFRISPDMVNKIQRQIGKVMELGLGYEGGVGAFITFALVYGLDLDELAAIALPIIPRAILEEAEKSWNWAIKKDRTLGLERDVYIVCDSFKRTWRYAHPKTTDLWADLDEAVRDAIANPGTTYHVADGKLKVGRVGAWLRIALPSDRVLCYPAPRVIKGKITYDGVNQYSRKWSGLQTYGGKLVENVVQAIARDIMAYGMQLAEDNGYEVVLSVHDELLTETPDNDNYTHETLAALMSTNPPWAEGLPLAAAGFEAHRYRKE